MYAYAEPDSLIVVHAFSTASSTTRIQVREPWTRSHPAGVLVWVYINFEKYFFVLAGPKGPVISLSIQLSDYIYR